MGSHEKNPEGIKYFELKDFRRWADKSKVSSHSSIASFLRFFFFKESDRVLNSHSRIGIDFCLFFSLFHFYESPANMRDLRIDGSKRYCVMRILYWKLFVSI